MAPVIVEDILKSRTGHLRVLDPMSGSGTTLAAAARFGHFALGFDTDPLALLLSSVLCNSVNREEVLEIASNLLSKASRNCGATSLKHVFPNSADDETKSFIKYWFCPTSRRQLCCLSMEISSVSKPALRNVLWVSLSRLIIKKDRGSSLAMDVSHSRPHKIYNTAPNKPFDFFLTSVLHVLKGLETLYIQSPGQIQVKKGDARLLPVRKNSIDLVITSPPYFNAIDYLRGHKLSLVWMGYKISEIRSIRSTNIGAEVGIDLGEKLNEIDRIIDKMADISLLPNRKQNMLRRYVSDMNAVVRETSRVLRPNGEAFYVVGDSFLSGAFVKNSEAIKILSKKNGLKFLSSNIRQIPNNRRYLPPPGASGNQAMDCRMREEVVLRVRKPS
jgi:DNA modification methylase